MVYFGLSAGPVLGGLLVEVLGWRGLFWVHAALSLLVVVLVVLRLRGDDRQPHNGGIDWWGTILWALGLALLLGGVSELPQPSGFGFLFAGLVLLVVFWLVESKIANPMLPITLFTQNRVFAFSSLASMISYSATFAVAFFLSLYLQVARGLAPGLTGLILIAQPLVQALFSPLTGRLSDRISPRLLASLGMALTAVGLGVLTLIDAQTPLVWVVAALFLLGIGFALFSSPNTNSVMGSVDKAYLGLASATLATVRTIGQMLSMGLALVLLSLILGKAAVTPETVPGFLAVQRWGFGISSVLCALGIPASLARGSTKIR
jgi:MFS family permease